MDYFRRYSALDTADLLQPSVKDKQTKGGVMLWTLLVYYNRVQRTSIQTEDKVSKSKLFVISLIFESNPWHDMMNVNFLRVIPPCI